MLRFGELYRKTCYNLISEFLIVEKIKPFSINNNYSKSVI